MKHLNPRQGITTLHNNGVFCALARHSQCETPKSPPGDYNPSWTPRQPSHTRTRILCETPKSPPGDYNHSVSDITGRERTPACETPKSPPGDYNPPNHQPEIGAKIRKLGVKHLNPRQGITTNVDNPVPEDGEPGVKHLNPRQGITTVCAVLAVDR